MPLDMCVDSVRHLVNLSGLSIDYSNGFHTMMWGRDKTAMAQEQHKKPTSHSAANDHSRCCKLVPQPEVLSQGLIQRLKEQTFGNMEFSLPFAGKGHKNNSSGSTPECWFSISIRGHIGQYANDVLPSLQGTNT